MSKLVVITLFLLWSCGEKKEENSEPSSPAVAPGAGGGDQGDPQTGTEDQETKPSADISQVSLSIDGPSIVRAGECAAVHALASTDEDVSENPPNVAFSIAGFNGTVFSDDECSEESDDLSLTLNQSKIFYFKIVVAGEQSVTIRVADPSLESAVYKILVAPSENRSLTLSAAATIVAGRCLELTVNAKDQFNNQIALGSGVRSNLRATGSHLGGLFYSSSTCAEGTEVDVTSAQNGSKIYFRQEKAGSLSLLLEDIAKVFASGTHLVSVVADIPASMGFDRQTFYLAAGECHNTPLKLYDQFDNEALATEPLSLPIQNLVGGAGLALFTDSGCTTTAGENLGVEDGGSRGNLWIKSDGRMPATGLVAAGGSIVGTGNGIGIANLNFLILKPAATVAIVGPMNVSVNECKSFRFQLLDEDMNATVLMDRAELELEGAELTEPGSAYTLSGCEPAYRDNAVSIYRYQHSAELFYKVASSGNYNLLVSIVTADTALTPTGIGVTASP